MTAAVGDKQTMTKENPMRSHSFKVAVRVVVSAFLGAVIFCTPGSISRAGVVPLDAVRAQLSNMASRLCELVGLPGQSSLTVSA